MEWSLVSRMYDPAKYHYNALPEVRWIVEHITCGCRVLDVGCLDSGLMGLLYPVTFIDGIDTRPAKGILHGDIRTYKFERTYDVIVFLSTLEHIGLCWYGNTIEDIDGDVQALCACRPLLKYNGRVLVTVPYSEDASGKIRCGVFWERCYNYNTIMTLVRRARYEVVEYYENRPSSLVCLELQSRW